MIYSVQRLMAERLVTLTRLVVAALAVLAFFYSPAFASEIIGLAPEKFVQDYQLAQARICLPPSRMINGRCVRTNLPRQICRLPKKLINGRCQRPIRPRVCRLPKVMVRGVCKLPDFRQVCRLPNKMINGRCQRPIRPRVCRLPKVMVRGVCKLPDFRQVCRLPNKMINGRCQRPIRPRVCRLPKVMVRGVCKLPDFRPACRLPKVIIRGRCQLPDLRPACRLPKRIINGRCRLPNPVPPICRLPKKFINGRCRLPIRPPVCQLPDQLIGGVCRTPDIDACERGRVWRNGRCVRPNPVCRAPRVRSPFTGRCYLPFDIVPIPEAQCRSPWYYSARAGGCVKPRPRPRPKENILWIQSCLNQLGYRAGTEDGLAGRKTRSAWDSFRRGIGELGYAEFDDPRTLAQLYRQCAPGQAPEPRPPVEQTLPPVRGDTLPPLPSDGLSYRPAMCATGSLYTLLNKTYGNTITLERCGRSCLPIPDGMALSEVRRLETESGVNWCKSCTKLGDEGILCPLPNRPLG